MAVRIGGGGSYGNSSQKQKSGKRILLEQSVAVVIALTLIGMIYLFGGTIK